MNPEEQYRSRLITAEDAANLIKSGDRVAFTQGIEPLELSLALVARKEELEGVKIFLRAPGRDLGWFDPGWEDSFHLEIGHVLPLAQQAMEDRRCDYVVGNIFWQHYWDEIEVDVLVTQISPPDEHGFCSFGASLWNKKAEVRAAKIAIAEVNPNFIRTYGHNFIHVSELDYFVKHIPTGKMPATTDLLGRKTQGPGKREKAIAEAVSSLIQDGDCLEIGVGGVSEWIVGLGALNDKQDLGWHSENTPSGIATFVKNGVITGKRKQIHNGKAVATAVGGGTKEEMDFINMNPVFEVYESGYVLNPKIIATNDNVVAINSALAVDFTGQIAAESLGRAMVSGTGGQLAFAIGANISQGGRNITILTSTAKQGTLSRIVPAHAIGTVVTTPRTLADLIVTEYGVARLKGKSQRQRAEELIAIAHPDFRSDLRKEAAKLF